MRKICWILQNNLIKESTLNQVKNALIKEGVSFVFKTKAILGALTLDMISVLFGGAIALAAVFATDILQVGSEGFGILVAAPNVGSFLTMLVTAYIPIVRKAGMKLLVAVTQELGVVTVVAALVPARRATSIDPTRALQGE